MFLVSMSSISSHYLSACSQPSSALNAARRIYDVDRDIREQLIVFDSHSIKTSIFKSKIATLIWSKFFLVFYMCIFLLGK